MKDLTAADFLVGKRIHSKNYPLSSLITSAYMSSDHNGKQSLKIAFPFLIDEVESRILSSNGLIDGEDQRFDLEQLGRVVNSHFDQA